MLCASLSNSVGYPFYFPWQLKNKKIRQAKLESLVWKSQIIMFCVPLRVSACSPPFQDFFSFSIWKHNYGSCAFLASARGGGVFYKLWKACSLLWSALKFLCLSWKNGLVLMWNCSQTINTSHLVNQIFFSPWYPDRSSFRVKVSTVSGRFGLDKWKKE